MKKYKFPGDRLEISIEARTFDEFHGITLFCAVLNEEATIKPYLEYYKPYFKSIVLIDGGSTDKTIEIAAPMVDEIVIHRWTGHCSNQFNRAMEVIRTDWAMFLEPDERLDKRALESLPGLIEQEEYDCYSFPRREIMDGTEDTTVYPDYQDRLFKTYCRRVRPVHGELVGYHAKKVFPINDAWDIIHNKTSKIHAMRNIGWAAFGIHFAHEEGRPGLQMRDSFTRKYKDLLIGKDGKMTK